MHKPTTAIVLSVLSGAVVVALAGPISSATAATTPVSAQDKAFFISNAQSNLAEIALGKLGGQRGGDTATKTLASVTLTDHQRLETQLATVAQAAGITLPAAPNAMQQATAATLMSTPTASFDLAYAQAEVMGHQMAISAANLETTAGTDANLKSYATGYIPIATMHLQMAQTEVATLSGSAPSSVNAGSGGLAATSTSNNDGPLYGTTIGLLIVTGSAGLLLRRRRSSNPRLTASGS